MRSWLDTYRTQIMLAGAAIAVRLLFVLLFPGATYFAGISDSYLHVADNVLSGHGVVTYVDIAPLEAAERLFSYEPFIDRPLGYLLFILPVYGLFGSVLAVQIFQSLLAGMSVLFLRYLGTEWIDARAGGVAAWAYALWPLAARFETTVLPDAVMPFFLLSSLVALQEAARSPSRVGPGLLAGILFGAGLTMRPDVLILPVFLLAAFWIAKRTYPGTAKVIGFAVGITLVMALHTFRNYEATSGKIVPLGLGNGISMWEGISQFGDTLGTLYGDGRLAEKEGYATWAYPDGVERDRQRFTEAVGILMDNPGFTASLIFRRMAVIVTVDGIMTTHYAPSIGEYLAQQGGRSLLTYAQEHPFALFVRAGAAALHLLTVLLAFVALRWIGRYPGLWIPFLVNIYYIVIHLPTNTESRYLYPVIPCLLLMTAVVWTHRYELIPRPGVRERHDTGVQ